MGQLANRAQGGRMQAARPQNGIAALLNDNWDRIAAVMPKHMSSERLFQLAVSTINQTPQLAEASPQSLLSCVMKCSALGLEPSAVDGLGRAYILPFRNHGRMEAQFLLGYKGMIDLARRSGQIRSIEARAVHDGDVFEFEYGLDEKLRHVPALGKQGPLTHVYCIAQFTDGGHYIDVMTKDEVDDIRKRSKASGKGPWVTDYEQMARKTVVRRAFPYLPVSVEAQTAAASDETTPDYAEIFNPVVEEPQPPVQVEAQVEQDPVAEAVDMLRDLGYDPQQTANYLREILESGGEDAFRAEVSGMIEKASQQ